MNVFVTYLDGSSMDGRISSIRVDGQFITIEDEIGDSTIVNGNAVKSIQVEK